MCSQRPCARLPAVFVVLLAWVLALGPAAAADRSPTLDSDRLRAVMAAYLVNFAMHIRWPEEPDSERQSLTLVVLGPDRLGEALDRAVVGRTVGGLPLRVVRVPDLAALSEGALIFLDNPAPGEAERVAQALVGRPTLLVAYSSAPEGTPAAIDLVLMRDGTLRYKLAISRLREAGLTPSAGLLQNALRGDARLGQLNPPSPP